MSDSGKWTGWVPWVAGFAVAGLVLRVIAMGGSAYGDEMSTLWIIRGNDIFGVVSAVHSDAEISPPLYFLLAKVSSWVFGQTPTGIRIPSLVFGVLVIPIFYLAGLRAVGRRAALYGTAIAAFSPLLIYFSANARAYSLMIFLLVLSTWFLLRATAPESKWWNWAGWAVAGVLAVYCHYTAGLVLAGQFVWALWLVPGRRKETLVWTLAMAVAFLPWASGFLADLDSPTSVLLEVIQGKGLMVKLEAVKQLFFLRLEILPDGAKGTGFFNRPEVLLGVAGLLLAIGGSARRWRAHELRLPDGPRARGLALLALMTIAVFVGELLLLVAGTDIFGTRNLAVAWVGMPLLIGALLAAAGRTTGVIALVLILAGFGINNIRLLDPARTAIPYSTAADWIEQREDRGGVILDGSIISPSPLSPLDGYLSTELPEYRLTNIEDRPDFIERMYEPYDAQAVVDQAFSGQGPVHVVLHGQVPRQLGTGRSYGFFAQDQPVRLPRGWTATEEVDLPGLEDLHISTFTRKAEADE